MRRRRLIVASLAGTVLLGAVALYLRHEDVDSANEQGPRASVGPREPERVPPEPESKSVFRTPPRIQVKRSDGGNLAPSVEDRKLLDGNWTGKTNAGAVAIDLNDGVGYCRVEKDGTVYVFYITFAEYWSRRRVTFALQPEGKTLRFTWDAVILGEGKLGIERVDMYDRLFPMPFDLIRQ